MCRVFYPPKKYSESFVDHFPFSKNRMIVSVSTQKLFHAMLKPCKSPIEKTGICYEESRLLKVEISRDKWDKNNVRENEL